MNWVRKTREKLQQWLRDLLEKIPRKTQVFINLGLILVLPLVIYLLLGSPVNDPEAAFRRAEKANLVGPSEILGIETVDGMWGDTYVIADNGDSAILYLCDRPVDFGFSYSNSYNLIYRPKMGSVSVYGLHWFTFGLLDDTYPLIVMDDHPEAVRAELELELFWQDSETLADYRKAYSLSAVREHPGYFRMDIVLDSDRDDQRERDAIEQLSGWFAHPPTYLEDVSCLATVRLYNEADERICERSVDLFPEADGQRIGQ